MNDRKRCSIPGCRLPASAEICVPCDRVEFAARALAARLHEREVARIEHEMPDQIDLIRALVRLREDEPWPKISDVAAMSRFVLDLDARIGPI